MANLRPLPATSLLRLKARRSSKMLLIAADAACRAALRRSCRSFPTGCPEMPFTWAIADRGMGPVAQLYDVSMSLGGPDVMISRIR
ncbi:MAG: hypothetical protein QOC88_3070 [Mycobacterium sp.]|nr:hypothetical protein [Mycobacterium sp.]